MSCDGTCCERFPIGHLTWDEIQARQATTEDGGLIADMIVPLGDGYFTCRHWNRETRQCGIYEQRPRMCRHYPYGRLCEHCGWGPTDTLIARYIETAEVLL